MFFYLNHIKYVIQEKSQIFMRKVVINIYKNKVLKTTVMKESVKLISQ